MNKIDAFLLLGTGYACGCSCFAGYGVHAFKNKFLIVRKWPLLWALVSMVNGLVLGFTTIFLFVFFTIGDKPGYPDFLPRAILFSIGLILGMFLVLNYFSEKKSPRPTTQGNPPAQ